MNQRQACQRRLLEALTDEMQRRPQDDWEARERRAITVAANQWAASHRLPVRLFTTDVELVEHHAMGHVDYASKLALYVTDLIYPTTNKKEREHQP